MNDKKTDKKEDDTLNPQPPTEIPPGVQPGDVDAGELTGRDDGRDHGADDLTEIFEKGEGEASPSRVKKARRAKSRRKRPKSKTARPATQPKEQVEKPAFDFDMKNEDLKELFQTASVLIAIKSKSANWLMPDEIAEKMSSAYVKGLTIFAPKMTPEILAVINMTGVTLQYIYGAIFGMFLTEKSKYSFAGKKDAGQMVSDKLNKINQWFSKKKNAEN